MKRIILLFCTLLLFSIVLSAQHPAFRYEYEVISLDSTFNTMKKSELSLYLDDLRQKLSKKMDVVIGVSSEELTSFSPASPLSNFLTDKLYEYGDEYLVKKKGVHADLSLLNMGGIRTDMPQGKITVGDIFNIIPFDNSVVIIALKGKELRKIFLKFQHRNGEPYSQLSIIYKQDRPFTILVKGEPIDDERIYYIVTADFLATHGDNIIPKEIVYEDIIYTKKLLRDVIIDKIKELTKAEKQIEGVMDERVIIEPQYFKP